MGVEYRKLDAVSWQAVRAQLFLVQQAERELAKQRQLLDVLVSQSVGVDISDGNWSLDIEHGLIEKEPQEQPQAEKPDDLAPRRAAKKRVN